MQAGKPWLLWMIKTSIVLTVCVIVLGAYTRLSDAGLGCPDWPGCYGQLSVPTTSAELDKASQLYPDLHVEQDKAWAEMIHRYFAGSLGLLVFAITALALGQRNTGRALPLFLSLLIVAQALLGMWTVTLKLMPLVVLAHLFGGFTLLSLLVIIHSKVEPIHCQITVNSQTRVFGALAFIAIIGQIFLGGWTSSNYAALMCTSLPICQGDWVSHLDFNNAFSLYQPGHDSYEFGVLDYGERMTIHVSHRIGALVATSFVLMFCWQLKKQQQAELNSQSNRLLALVFIQFSLGVSNVLFQLPLIIAVLHNLGGALLLAALTRTNYLLITNSVTDLLSPYKPKHIGSSHE
mgnify:CR=1 FL=1